MVRHPLLIFACLAAMTEAAVAALPERNTTLVCTGRMTSDGNDGHRDWGAQSYTVTIDSKGKGSAFGGPWGGANFCKADPMCTYKKGHHKLVITYNEGNLGMSQMTIDFLTGAFEFGGGGIDGGSHTSGKCVKPDTNAGG